MPTVLALEHQMRLYREDPPRWPVAAAEWERRACAVLDARAWAYLGGAGREETMAENLAAFRRWRIRPRMLTDISTPAPEARLFGLRAPAPVVLAPIGLQELYHPEAELASARAAAAAGLPFVQSCQASRSIEEVAAAAPEGGRLFQLYWSRERALTASLVARAEAAGHAAIVLTVDTKMLGWRERDLGLGHNPFLEGKGLANLASDPVFRELAGPDAGPARIVETFLRVFGDPALAWEDLAWLRGLTRLPILVKGVQHPDDARRAIDCGVEGVVVSNHGGRQVDGGIASLEALPEIAAAAGGALEIGFDSGVRSGADAFKALALGADFVALGRPWIHGLAVGGEAGVRRVLENFLCELRLTLALSGCRTWEEITPGLCVPAG